MTIRLHDSISINDPIQGEYKIKCSPHSVVGLKGISRSRREMGQINIVGAKVGENGEELPVLVLALVTMKIGDDSYAPFFIVAPMIEVYQTMAYLPYTAYKFDVAFKGGWVYKIIQAKHIQRPLCAVPVLKKGKKYAENPHNDKETWYYVINKERFTYGTKRQEQYYTEMTPQTKVFPTYDELLEYQEGMGLAPNFSNDSDYNNSKNDSKDIDDSDSNSDEDIDDDDNFDYDDDEIDIDSRHKIHHEDERDTEGVKRAGNSKRYEEDDDDSDAEDEEENDSDS